MRASCEGSSITPAGQRVCMSKCGPNPLKAGHLGAMYWWTLNFKLSVYIRSYYQKTAVKYKTKFSSKKWWDVEMKKSTETRHLSEWKNSLYPYLHSTSYIIYNAWQHMTYMYVVESMPQSPKLQQSTRCASALTQGPTWRHINTGHNLSIHTHCFMRTVRQ